MAEIRAIVKAFKERPVGLAEKEYPDREISKEFFEPLLDAILSAFNGEDERICCLTPAHSFGLQKMMRICLQLYRRHLNISGSILPDILW